MPGNNILIADEAGGIIDIINENEAGENVETFTGMLVPGFINSHCHLELSHLKGIIPPGTGLVNFVQQVMTKRGLNEEMKMESMRLAEEELYQNGVAAVGDICNTTDSIPVKEKSKIHWHNFIEVSGFVDSTANNRLTNAQLILGNFIQSTGNNKHLTLSPHAPYSVSKTLFELLNKETVGQLITIHNQESAAENELYKNKQGSFLDLYENFNIDISGFQPTGKSSLQSWFPYFTNNQSIILVHNTFINNDDIDFIRWLTTDNCQSPTYFCLCVNANKYIEKKIPPINLLREKNCTLLIGTDSYASNWQLNILDEIKTVLRETDYNIPLREILQWATINGAKALRMEEKFGSFEKGKKPGIVLIDKLKDGNITNDSSSKRIL